MPGNEEVAQAIISHHRQLQEQLVQRVGALYAAIDRGDGSGATQRQLLDFLHSELLAHAKAEERTLYDVDDQSPIAVLVDAMIAEHRTIEEHVQKLELAGSALDALSAASAIQALFETHLEKENGRLLPVLVADERISLAGRLSGMREILGESTSRSEDPRGEIAHTAETELDVRIVPPVGRHGLIFATFEALAPGQTFVLVNDHDPKPLYYQFAAERDGEFTWHYVERGPETWRVRIGRIPADVAEPVR